MSTSRKPTPVRNRYEDYAPKLFEDRARQARRQASRTPPKPARRGAPRRRPGPRTAPSAPRRNPLSLAVAIAAGVALAWLVHAGGSAELMAYARPDPREYRREVALVSIDRVGTMFYGVVSQGFFLEEAEVRRQSVDRLIRRIRAEGYSSLYLAEASGRTVVRWNGRVLEMVPDTDAGT